MSTSVPTLAQEAVLVSSVEMPKDAKVIKGFDFAEGVDYKALFESYKTFGLQASSLAHAIEEVNKMVSFSCFVLFCFVLFCFVLCFVLFYVLCFI